MVGVARAVGGIVLALSGAEAVESNRVDAGTARLLGAGLIAVGLVAAGAGLGLMRRRAWAWRLGFLAIFLFVADGLLNGYLLFGRPGDKGTVVNLVAASFILVCLLRGRPALERSGT